MSQPVGGHAQVQRYAALEIAVPRTPATWQRVISLKRPLSLVLLSSVLFFIVAGWTQRERESAEVRA
jgi:hypothetical protein